MHGEGDDSFEEHVDGTHEAHLPSIAPASPSCTGVAGGESARRWRSAYEPLPPPVATQHSAGEHGSPPKSLLVWRPTAVLERPEAMEEAQAIAENKAAEEDRMRATRRYMAARRMAEKRLAMRERFDAKLLRMINDSTSLPT